MIREENSPVVKTRWSPAGGGAPRHTDEQLQCLI